VAVIHPPIDYLAPHIRRHAYNLLADCYQVAHDILQGPEFRYMRHEDRVLLFHLLAGYANCAMLRKDFDEEEKARRVQKLTDRR